MPLDPLDPRPAYQQVAAALRDRITAGTYGPGDRLPSARELVAEFGVAAMTARTAVRELEDDGLVISQQGRGVFVRDGSAVRQSAASREFDVIMRALDGLRRDLRALGDRVSEIEAQVLSDRRASRPTKRSGRQER